MSRRSVMFPAARLAMSTPLNLADLVGRILMSVIFVVAGLDKAIDYAATRSYMELHGVLSAFLPLVIVLELVGALAISIGYRTRVFAFLLAAYVVLAALLFHADFNDPIQQSLFMKNLAMAGGFLVILARGPGEWSLDARIERQSGEPALIPH